ncbi:MAG: glycosyltransferase family 25 protein [Albidovulum sp.]
MLAIHVINLDRRPDRLAALSSRLDMLGLGWNRVAAIDAMARDPAELSRAFGAGPASRAFPATPGDMACSLTHQRLWHEIASARVEAAIVLEDDAGLADSFADLANCDLAGVMRRNGMGAMKLEFWPGPQSSRRFPVGQDLGPVNGSIRLFRMRSSFLGTCAYVITAEAARKLLSAHRVLEVPVDHFLFGQSAGRGFDLLRPGFVNPAPVLHDVDRFGSDISAERPAKPPRRPFARRWHEYRQRRKEEAAMSRGECERVEMRYAGDAPRASTPSSLSSPSGSASENPE